MYFNCHTCYSFNYGTLTVESLFEEAVRCGVRKLVLTDINSTAAYIELLRIANENRSRYDLEVALGVEFRWEGQLLYIALAHNNEGFEEINRFLSFHNRQKTPIPVRAPSFNQVSVVYPWSRWKTLDPLALMDNEYVGIRHTQINQVLTSHYAGYTDRLVAWEPVTFKSKSDFNVHRLLRAIDKNVLLSRLPVTEQADSDEVMQPESYWNKWYERYPNVLENARRLTNSLSIQFTLGTDKNLRTFTGSYGADLALLRSKAWEGFCKRYNPDDLAMLERFEKELSIIFSKRFVSYYLIADEIVSYARHRNFPYVGRGSGANSMIAYCLRITNVDPVELDLYFERFLNPERSSPPDFDIDFSWKDRDEVTSHIFQRFNNDHVALLGTHTTYKDRSVLRELGKVFGLPKSEIDALVENRKKSIRRDHIVDLILKYAERIYSLPSNLSIHAGGVLITEKPIYAYTATDIPPKGFPVVHFEMHNAEDIGIYKFDILSQRGLGHIKDTVELVQKNKKEKIDIENFSAFKRDEKIKALLRKGRTMGCFYVESPAMRMLLAKLECSDYRTLVAASSIIRPGVARSGMMRTFIERHHAVTHGGTYEAIH
ncbi:MAG: PHP domain-containing protein, partial [Cyclobacteriaceae bacterium]|nr:PHP domain-containing protein [Cyclobacteriaceae bacterium]